MPRMIEDLPGAVIDDELSAAYSNLKASFRRRGNVQHRLAEDAQVQSRQSGTDQC